jgi:hypothetical protein
MEANPMISNNADPTGIAPLPTKSLSGGQRGCEIVVANVEHFRMHIVWSPGFSRQSVMGHYGRKFFASLGWRCLWPSRARDGAPYK